MAEQEQNRNEAATPHKLEEARKQGNVPKSLDVNSFVMLLGGTIALYAWGSSISGSEMKLFAALLSNAHLATFDPEKIGAILPGLLRRSLGFLAPVFVLLCLLAIVANFAQIGPVFSWSALKPEIDRLNPVLGFKKIFSLRLLVETIKTVLKFLLLGTVFYYAMRASLPALMVSMHGSPASIGGILLAEGTAVLFKLLAALAVVTAIDLGYSRWDFSKRLRMSRREITDEHKRREGDPRIKARLRELQRETLKRARSAGRVKDADVLIVNPVHLAVAVKYDKGQIDAPIVVAKGAGFLAWRMRAEAARHGVPIVQNRSLARALFHRVRIDQSVPEQYYRTLARILVWVFATRGKSHLGEAAR